MADNEIKIKISAENMDFIRKVQECIKALSDQEQAVKDANGKDIKPPTAKIPNWLQEANASAEKFLQRIRQINEGLTNAARIATTVQLPIQRQPVNVDSSAAQRTITSLGTLLRGLADINPKLTVDIADAKTRIQNIASEIGKIKNATIKVDLKGVNADNLQINVDTNLAKQRIRDLQRLINELKSNGIKIDINMSGAAQAIAALQTQLSKLKSANIKIEIDAGTATQTAKSIASEIQKIKSKKVSITLKSNVTAAEINRINTLLGKLKSTHLTVSVNTTSAMINLTRLKTLAIEVQRALAQIRLPNVDITGVTALLAALRRLEYQARNTQGVINQIHGPSGGGGAAGGSVGGGGILGMLSQLTVAAAGVLAVLGQIKDVAASIVMPGFNYTKEMETNQLGIAGILQSMTLLNGQAVSFGDAMNISAGTMKRLQKEAILTSATTEEMVTTFRALLAPGLGAGMTIEEIEKVTSVGVNAVKAMGLNSTQLVQELRDLVQGGIQASSSTLATSLGLTDADIKAAKASSEGLFKFLMKRLQGFGEMAKHFPNTLSGKMSQLKEVSVLASAEITKAFEDDFKDVVGKITDMIADINMETGEITFNPTIMEFVQDLKKGWQEISSFIEDVAPSDSQTVSDLVSVFKSLYNIVTDVILAMMDFLRIMVNSDLNQFQEWVTLIKSLANEVEWLTKKFREFYDARAKALGVKQESAASWADFKHSEDTNTKKQIDNSNLTSKFESRAQKEAATAAAKAAAKAQKEAIKQSQQAMRESLSYLRNFLDTLLSKYDKEITALKLKKDQGNVSNEDYYRQLNAVESRKQLALIESLNKEKEVIANTQFTEESEKNTKIQELDHKIAKATDTLKEFDKVLVDINNILASKNSPALKGEGTAWVRNEVENPKYDQMENTAKQALESIADFAYKLTNIPMQLTSGKRSSDLGYSQSEIGGHGTGMKFDLVSEAMNNPELRQKVIDYATSLGVEVLDEYANPTARATGKHLDFNAENFTGLKIEQKQNEALKIAETETGLKLREDLQALNKKRDDVLKQWYENQGDITTIQTKEMIAEYDELEKIFRVNNDPETVKKINNLRDSGLRNVKFNQSVKDIESASSDLLESQEELLKDIANGTNTAAGVTKEFAATTETLFNNILAELGNQLKDASGDKDLERKIKVQMKQIRETIKEGFEAILQSIDTKLQEEIAKVNYNPNLTRMQKEESIDELTRKAYLDKASAAELELKIKEDEQISRNKDNSVEIAKLKQQIALNKELAKVPPLMNKINQAGKQGLEDGILNFFETGINECKSYAEAFRNMGKSILQSMQKVLADKITRQFMSILGFGASSGGRPTGILGPLKADGNFAEGGNMNSGKVSGPGSGTSDSILAWIGNLKKFVRISDGEYVIKASAARKIGTRVLDHINNGMIPDSFYQAHQQFAAGGAMINSLPSPGFNNTNSVNVPVTVNGFVNPLANTAAMSSEMRNEVEELFIRFLKKYS